MPPDLYLPIAFVEALGWATVARYQFELSANILLVVLTSRCGYDPTCLPRDPLEIKIQHLLGLQRSRYLKHEWWMELRQIGRRAKELDRQYLDGAMSCTYSRGSGHLESLLRASAEKIGVAPSILSMTPSKLNDVADAFRSLTRRASDLATSLLEASERLSPNSGLCDD